MTYGAFRERARTLWRRAASIAFFRGPVEMRNEAPVISFTFDDFPRSAYQVGGGILKTHGCRGTYYTALGLLGKQSPVGEIFSQEDLSNVIADGHELGCHTFGHCHAGNTVPRVFENSIVENERCLSGLLPDASFKTLAYPISDPRPNTKRRAAKHFPCCRFGGQTYNAGVADRYLLAAYFLEQSKHDPDSVKRMIDENSDARGWLIFATHDVCDKSTRFGVSPGFFEDVVRYASGSGAAILPVGDAWDLVSGLPSPGIADAGGREEPAVALHAESRVAP